MIGLKQFLIEWDRGDLDWAQSIKDEEAKRSPNKVKKAINELPEKGDVIKTQSKQFMVVGLTNGSYALKELGGDKKDISIPQAKFEFKPDGETKLGKRIFKVIKK